jgi:Fe-S cluster assembly ATP-binding protein
MLDGKQPVFSMSDIHVWAEDKEIVKGVNLQIEKGKVHAVMGPNGSGKSTLASALAGHPSLRLEGRIDLDGEEIQGMAPHERARRGLFLGFQYPVAIPGVTVNQFLKSALEAKAGKPPTLSELRSKLSKAFGLLDIPNSFGARYINDGFSGGEKKRLEILQMLVIEPKIALLDEIDSGLDIDALKLVSNGINHAKEAGMGILLVTHYQRILDHVKPDFVHVFKDGRIVKSGGPEQALELEAKGYEWIGDVPLEAVGGI